MSYPTSQNSSTADPSTDPNARSDGLALTATDSEAGTDAIHPDVGARAHVTISLDQARRIGELMDVCDDLLRNGSDQVRADLARSMLACNMKTLDRAWFIDMVGFTARYLHARIARAAPTRHQPSDRGAPAVNELGAPG